MPLMKTIPLEVRERILGSYDKQQATRQEIADRFGVSLGMVKKLLQQREHMGDISPQHHRSGRKPMITETHHRRMRTLLDKKPGLTLKQLRDALKLDCSLPAIHYALQKIGLKQKKKKRSASASKAASRLRKHTGRNRK
jgi:transposase